MKYCLFIVQKKLIQFKMNTKNYDKKITKNPIQNPYIGCFTANLYNIYSIQIQKSPTLNLKLFHCSYYFFSIFILFFAKQRPPTEWIPHTKTKPKFFLGQILIIRNHEIFLLHEDKLKNNILCSLNGFQNYIPLLSFIYSR